MTSVLFVTNGYGEMAIADRISLELHRLEPSVASDHLALVAGTPSETMREVGPRRPMPSGGLIAMGNVRNIAADLRAGLAALTYAQYRFLRRARGSYDVVVAVGDVYAFVMTLQAGAPAIFVGTAKSVSVAPYGPFEMRLLRRAAACFVRDEPTARRLRARSVPAQAANVIVDLSAPVDSSEIDRAVANFAPVLALLPGSRESAYDDATLLLEVTRELAATSPRLGAALSIAPGLDAARFAAIARSIGWEVRMTEDAAVPFACSRGDREIVRGWRGAIGPLLGRATLVLGQAGTANEAAAAAGVPVIAFERERDRRARWYRQRQRGLLGDALSVISGGVVDAVSGVRAILEDPVRMHHMSETGRARMGAPGGARRIAERIAAMATAS